MKKILLIFSFALIAIMAKGQLDTVNYGSYANDPAADKARQAFEKLNVPIRLLNNLGLYDLNASEVAILNGALVSTTELNRLVGVTAPIQTQINARVSRADSTGYSAGNYVTRKALVDTIDNRVGDNIDAFMATAAPAANYFWELNDTGYTHKQIITWDQFQAGLSTIGGGSGGTVSTINKLLQFTIGSTAGAPGNGDSTVYHSDLLGMHKIVYRGTTADLHRQRYNATSRNGVTGYRISNDTVIVRPAFSTGETVLIEPDSVSFLTFGTNSLLSGLMGYWKMDEPSGSTMNDAHSTNVDGVISAGVTLAQTGAINYGYDFNGTSSNVNLGTACRPTSAISISLWFNTTDISTEQQLVGNAGYGSAWCGYRVTLESTGGVNFFLGTNSATMLDKTYSSGKDDGNLHHVVCTWNGSSAYIYIDNVKSTASVMSSAINYTAANELRFGSNGDATAMFYGSILDEPCIYNRALTDAEVAILFRKKPYPFN